MQLKRQVAHWWKNEKKEKTQTHKKKQIYSRVSPVESPLFVVHASLNTGKKLKSMGGHENTVASVAWSPDGTKVSPVESPPFVVHASLKACFSSPPSLLAHPSKTLLESRLPLQCLGVESAWFICLCRWCFSVLHIFVNRGGSSGRLVCVY
jgi:hypothetical protein